MNGNHRGKRQIALSLYWGCAEHCSQCKWCKWTLKVFVLIFGFISLFRATSLQRAMLNAQTHVCTAVHNTSMPITAHSTCNVAREFSIDFYYHSRIALWWFVSQPAALQKVLHAAVLLFIYLFYTTENNTIGNQAFCLVNALGLHWKWQPQHIRSDWALFILHIVKNIISKQ